MITKIKLRIKELWDNNPVIIIMIFAAISRILAAFFAKGYGMHDDHFSPIEQPFIILNDFSVWLHRGSPELKSIVYPMIHYYLFRLLEALGITDPQGKMYFVRFIHAFFSLFIVYYGYKITELLSGRVLAKKAGLILALIWFMPFMSVRNLIEMVCIPPLMIGFYFLIRNNNVKKYIFIAGIFFGLSWIFRYQTMLLTGSIGLILIFTKQYKNCLLLVFGFLVSVLLIQGTVDYIAWGYPFASFVFYLIHNAEHGSDYTTGPFYNYLLLLTGLLIPPISLMIIYGFGRLWKKHYIIILPILTFFIFHSIYPNKQERFILPIVPLIIVIGIIGWESIVSNSGFWLKKKVLLKSCWVWFWCVNSILMLLFTFTYSKKTRCESLYYLSDKQDLRGVFISGGKLGTVQPPLFYLNRYDIPVLSLDANDENSGIAEKFTFTSESTFPNYIIFLELIISNSELLNSKSYLIKSLKLKKPLNQAL